MVRRTSGTYPSARAASVLLRSLYLMAICGSTLAPVCVHGQGRGSAHAPDANSALIQASTSRYLAIAADKIEIKPSPMAGLWEVHTGGEIYYSDPHGNFLVRGDIIDMRSRRNLTQEHIDQLSAIRFDDLPLQDALVWHSPNGGAPKRRVAVFADPNCGYCKALEAQFLQLKEVVVYTFLYPVLGADSSAKSQAIWCSSDASRAWREWMLRGAAPAAGASCPNPLQRNLELGRAHRIKGVPAIVFEDGYRSPGMLKAAQIEERFARHDASLNKQ